MIQKIKKLYFLRPTFYVLCRADESEDILNYSIINCWSLIVIDRKYFYICVEFLCAG